MNKVRLKKEYARHQKMEFFIPLQFLLLCRVLEVPPQKLLYDFMSNAGQEEYGLGNEQRVRAMEYVISCGYEGNRYTQSDMRQLFVELDAIGCLWPTDCEPAFLDMHSNWRDKYHQYWADKWTRKNRQKQFL